MDVNAHIKNKFRIKGNECLPYTGWLNSTREHIAELFNELEYKIGAEIGVQWGGYSQTLLEKIIGVTLYCVDPWSPWLGGRSGQERHDRIYRRAKRVLSQYKNVNVHLVRKKSMDALVDFQDNSLDFVYIDALHDFDNVMMDIIGWSKKVKSGGIVSGHDFMYCSRSGIPGIGCGVIPAVRGYTEGHNITQWYITQDYAPGPSFFWVKP